jgi:hypothetical protein
MSLLITFWKINQWTLFLLYTLTYIPCFWHVCFSPSVSNTFVMKHFQKRALFLSHKKFRKTAPTAIYDPVCCADTICMVLYACWKNSYRLQTWMLTGASNSWRHLEQLASSHRIQWLEKIIWYTETLKKGQEYCQHNCPYVLTGTMSCKPHLLFLQSGCFIKIPCIMPWWFILNHTNVHSGLQKLRTCLNNVNPSMHKWKPCKTRTVWKM